MHLHREEILINVISPVIGFPPGNVVSSGAGKKKYNGVSTISFMTTRAIKIRKSTYHALKAQKRTGESFSDVILRVTGGGEKSVCDFLQSIDPAVRSEIAESVKKAKSEFDRVRSRKVSLKP